MLPDKQEGTFENVRVPVRVQLAGLWTTVMFLYLYGDYFQLYQPGKLPSMLAGRTDIGAVTQGALFGMAALLAVPALMVAFSLMLPVRLNRGLNIGFGILYSGIMILAARGAWQFYLFYGLLEVALTMTIAWRAWAWPKH